MLANFARLFALTALIMGGLLSLLLAVTGQLATIVPMLVFTAAVVGFVALLALLVSLLFFHNRMHMRFRVDAKGVASDVADPRAHKANRLVTIIGLLSGRPGVAGAGLMAAADSHRELAWPRIARAHYHRHWHTITLANGWRTVMTLFCSADNYDAVQAAVRAALAARPAKAHHNPLSRLLLHSFLVVLACMPLFNLPFVGEDGVLPALLIMCFALAAVWLVPLLAWIVPLGLSWMTLLEITACSATRESLFGGTYVAYEVLDGGDLITLGLAVAGAAYLLWLSIGLIRGHIRSGLAGDLAEAEPDPA